MKYLFPGGRGADKNVGQEVPKKIWALGRVDKINNLQTRKSLHKLHQWLYIALEGFKGQIFLRSDIPPMWKEAQIAYIAVEKKETPLNKATRETVSLIRTFQQLQ